MKNIIKNALNDAQLLLNRVIDDPLNLGLINSISQEIASAFTNGRKVIICGNGGSLCDAMHFSEEFTGRFRNDRQPLPVIALSDAGHITCVGNDYGFDEVFSRGVQAYGNKGDIFIGLSTSGNSLNIVKANTMARELGLKSILLLGKDGGQLLGQSDIEIVIPGLTADRIQEVHMTILHIIIECVERIMFPTLYK